MLVNIVIVTKRTEAFWLIVIVKKILSLLVALTT